ncbi:MAG TPA: PIG-L family deacetylase [Polyangia bacterium]|nr:PIG-L family deacetylase [Polyangia bacterium]
MLAASLGAPGAPLRILCLGAHCDDIEIGCGGAVLRLLAERPGSTVRWVAFASNPAREVEARAGAAAFLEKAADRQVVIHKFRDGYLPFQGAEVKDAFEAAKADFRPDVVLTHHRHDRHQDHRMVAELTWNTYRDHAILEYEIPKYEGDLGTPNLYLPLTEAVARRKIDLIVRSYPSQAGKRWFRPETFEAVLRLRGIECNAPDGFAEAFHATKLVI